MENSKAKEHWQIHKKSFDLRIFLFAGLVFTGIGIIQYIFGEYGGFWRAAALRLYYVPVILLAFHRGLFGGLTAGLMGAGVHYFVMRFEMESAHSGVRQEHLVELPFLIMAGILIGFFRDHLHHEQDSRREVTNIFGSYVSPEVVEQALNKNISFEGEKADVSVLFSDIRGFTGFAESMSPEELLRMLNLYFAEMVEVIAVQHGYLDKFIGDAIMAVFGVPLARSDDPVRALRSAVAMHHRLMELNRNQAFGPHQLQMGIGLNTGPVIAGNLGSSKRMEYTVIGDAVNLASRLESLNKTYGSHILISDTTMGAVRDETEFLIREVDSVRVKGRRQPCGIFEVYNCCTEDEIQKRQDTMSDFISGLNFYKSGDWGMAETAFDAVLDRAPGDVIAKIYQERLHFLKVNPPENWEGVFDHLVK